MTISKEARHVRAELEAIAAGLLLRDLARLLELGRRLCEQSADDLGAPGGRGEGVASSVEDAPVFGASTLA